MAKRELPSPELLRKLLRYNKRTGKLHWKKRPPSMFDTKGRCDWWNRRYSGTEAFTATGTHGYKTGKIGHYGTLLAHRVIVAMLTGKWPENVDHDNRNRTDNRWINLIDSTSLENGKNRSINKNNTSGCTGVQFSKQTQKWRAVIYVNYERIGLGDHQRIEDAIAARRAAEVAYGYHPRHGRSAMVATAARSC